MNKKRKGYTLIEVLIVLTIIMTLSSVLLPKIRYSTDKARRTGVEKNKQTISSLATNYYEKAYETSADNDERIKQTYDKLTKLDEIRNIINPIDNTKTGLGYINGTNYDNSNKAAYILTNTPNESTFPDGTVILYFTEKVEVTEGSNPDLSYKEQYYFEDTTYKNIVSAGTYTLFKTPTTLYGSGTKPLTPVNGTIPTYIMSSTNIKDISTYTDTFVLDGTNLIVSGYNDYGELTPATSSSAVNKIMLTDSTITSITAINECNIIRKSNGEYYGIGRNDNGIFGLGHNNHLSSYTKLPVGATDTLYVAGMHSILLKADGTVYGSGFNTSGELGIGDTVSRNTFVKSNIDNVIKVYTFGETTAFLTKDGSLYYAGFMSTLGRANPTKVDITNIKHVSVGYGFLVVQTKDNELYAMGDNSYKQFGLGSSAPSLYSTFVNITPIDPLTSKKINVKEFYAATSSIFVIDTNGALYVAGLNTDAQLGLGDKVNRSTWTKNPYINFN